MVWQGRKRRGEAEEPSHSFPASCLSRQQHEFTSTAANRTYSSVTQIAASHARKSPNGMAVTHTRICSLRETFTSLALTETAQAVKDGDGERSQFEAAAKLFLLLSEDPESARTLVYHPDFQSSAAALLSSSRRVSLSTAVLCVTAALLTHFYT